MQHGFQRASLAPDGLAVDAVQMVADRVQILLRSRQPWGTCPDCGGRSRRVQCRYTLQVGCQGRPAVIHRPERYKVKHEDRSCIRSACGPSRARYFAPCQ